MADINNINVNGTTYNIVDDEAMRLASNPTNNNILVTNANGQAVDSGVSISGISGSGTTIYDDSVAYDELTFETVVSGADTIKVGIDMDLLWTNSSPTSTFAAQTINVDMSDYKTIILVFQWSTGGGGYINKVFTEQVDNGYAYGPRFDQYIWDRRLCNKTLTSIEFGECRAYNFSSAVNNEMIPYKIYGIR